MIPGIFFVRSELSTATLEALLVARAFAVADT